MGTASSARFLMAATAGIFVAILAPSCILDATGLSSYQGEGGSAGGGGQCNVPDDCTELAASTTCRLRVCVSGLCGQDSAPDGTPCPETEGGECVAGVCAGPDGAPCTSAAECTSGICSIDDAATGVCCASLCDGPCLSCARAGLEGMCVPSVAGTDTEDGCPSGVCDGSGHCAVGTPRWSVAFAGQSDQYPRGIAVDDQDQILLAAYFDGTLSFGAMTFASTPGSDVAVAKLSALGAHQWSKQSVGSQPAYVMDVDVGPQGEMVVFGAFSADIDLGGGALLAIDSPDLFLAKYDSMGAHVWSTRFAGVGAQEARSIDIDAAGNILLTGIFTGAFSFDGGTTTLSGIGGWDIYAAKLDAAGTHLWSKAYQSITDDIVTGAALDSTDNLVLLGSYTSALVLDGPMLPMPVAVDGFVAKIDPTGATLWARSLGGSGDEIGRAVAADSTGNLLVVGNFDTDITLMQTFTAVSSDDVFAAKLDPAGAFVWARSYGVAGTQVATAVAVDQYDNVIIGGYSDDTIDFGGIALVSAGNFDVFLAKLAPDATHLWSRRWGDTRLQRGLRMALNSNGGVLFFGDFDGTIDFGPPTMPHSSVNANDMFLVSVDP